MADTTVTVTEDSNSLAIGEVAARAYFRKQGEPPILTLTEQQLATICALAVQMTFDAMQEIRRHG